jgi:hypothetical protein
MCAKTFVRLLFLERVIYVADCKFFKSINFNGDDLPCFVERSAFFGELILTNFGNSLFFISLNGLDKILKSFYLLGGIKILLTERFSFFSDTLSERASCLIGVWHSEPNWE